MVPVLALAALAAMLAMPAGTQPRKSFAMLFPRRVTFGPGTVLGQMPPQTGKCSVPLLNALKENDRSADWGMPTLKPRVTGTMRLVDPPAPACADGQR